MHAEKDKESKKAEREGEKRQLKQAHTYTHVNNPTNALQPGRMSGCDERQLTELILH